MNAKEIEELVKEKGMVDEFRDLVMSLDESDANSRELWMTIWKDGRVTLGLTQRGNDYPPETYRSIREVIRFPRIVIYDDFDISSALNQGVKDDEIEEVAINAFKENFDLGEYLEKYCESD